MHMGYIFHLMQYIYRGKSAFSFPLMRIERGDLLLTQSLDLSNGVLHALNFNMHHHPIPFGGVHTHPVVVLFLTYPHKSLVVKCLHSIKILLSLCDWWEPIFGFLCSVVYIIIYTYVHKWCYVCEWEQVGWFILQWKRWNSVTTERCTSAKAILLDAPVN